MQEGTISIPFPGSSGQLNYWLTLKSLGACWAKRDLSTLNWWLKAFGQAIVDPLAPRECDKCHAKGFTFIRVQGKLICGSCVEHFLASKRI